MGKRDDKRRVDRQARRRWQKAAIALAAAAAIIVGYFAYRAVADLPGQPVPSLGNRHIATIDSPHEPYNSEPPTSGPHVPYIAPWGVHTRPIPRELQVHNLEDGGVLVQYNCDCPELVEQLQTVVRSYDRYVILAPYPEMSSRIALTAWGRIDTLDEFDARRIRRFIEAYRGLDHHR